MSQLGVDGVLRKITMLLLPQLYLSEVLPFVKCTKLVLEPKTIIGIN